MSKKPDEEAVQGGINLVAETENAHIEITNEILRKHNITQKKLKEIFYSNEDEFIKIGEDTYQKSSIWRGIGELKKQ